MRSKNQGRPASEAVKLTYEQVNLLQRSLTPYLYGQALQVLGTAHFRVEKRRAFQHRLIEWIVSEVEECPLTREDLYGFYTSREYAELMWKQQQEWVISPVSIREKLMERQQYREFADKLLNAMCVGDSWSHSEEFSWGVVSVQTGVRSIVPKVSYDHITTIYLLGEAPVSFQIVSTEGRSLGAWRDHRSLREQPKFKCEWVEADRQLRRLHLRLPPELLNERWLAKFYEGVVEVAQLNGSSTTPPT
jgi:hypothetical protein